MKSSEIREKFLQFFESKGHTVVRSSSLIPGNDPTLLFTNSGMVQFKDVFLGQDQRGYSRATTAQRCVRAGGKHNDLENVGYTARHHTFFEMMGNFSFGDYFKRDAIHYAWELLTVVYSLPKDKLTVTVYQADDEAYQIWQNEIGIPVERIIRIGDNKGAAYASDNFWQMAETGPCGPCSEIFYDHGAEIWGGPPGSADEAGDRFIEIWNLVFMQYNKDDKGVLHPLPKPCVDTGMGLERLSAVLQNVHSNYETDAFQTLINAAARETVCADLTHNSLKVIADHIRCAAFLIVDGIIPGNEGRGYVLRRITRRALRHGHKLGQTKPFFHKLIPDLVKEMGSAYPELAKAENHVAQILRQEEERFGETLVHGMKILEVALSKDGKRLDGRTAFTLYDTYGFPLDLTADICRERSVEVDQDGFNAAMELQKQTARTASVGKFKMHAGIEYSGVKTPFVGYEGLAHESKVIALYVDGSLVQQINAGESALVVLGVTPFYAESGGQRGDRGELLADDVLFEVANTTKIQPDVFGHHGELKKGFLSVGSVVNAQVNEQLRAQTVRSHSATHLMHKALRDILGSHVAQKGSLVDADKTRFDFSHHVAVTDEELRQVECRVNREIMANNAVQAQVMTFDDAVKQGAMALFGEKYGDDVRVLDIGSSRELCGGTHVKRTGDIGFFKIISESGIAAGIRRIEAVTGESALTLMQSLTVQVNEAATLLKSQPDDLLQRIVLVQEQSKLLEKELAHWKAKFSANLAMDLSRQAIEINGIKVLAAVLDDADPTTLREVTETLKAKLHTAIVIIAAVQDGKVSLVAGVTPNTTAKVKAGDLVNFVALQVGGKGGGRPDMAQAGGTNPAALLKALKSVTNWVSERV